ncbi:MAG: hypothetical protein KY437_06775 [Actinobacteria bacterium]|nr:hypothetical protein [Actinomycetota bacterium]
MGVDHLVEGALHVEHHRRELTAGVAVAGGEVEGPQSGDGPGPLEEDEVPGLELATGVPVVYDLTEDGTVRGKEVWE